MESKRALNEAIKQILQLEDGKLTVGSSLRLQIMRNRALWRSLPPPE
jgi:hypothetical protein